MASLRMPYKILSNKILVFFGNFKKFLVDLHRISLAETRYGKAGGCKDIIEKRYFTL